MGVLYARVGGSWQAVGMSTSDRWNNAWGLVATETAALTIADGTTVANNLTITGIRNLALVAGRRYRITFQIRAIQVVTTNTSGSFVANLMRSGGILQSTWFQCQNNYESTVWSWYINGDGLTTAADVTVVANNLQGGGLMLHLSGAPGTILMVEDVGPVAGAVAIPNPTPAWINLTLQNSWAPLGGVHQTPQYRIVGDEVQVRGTVKNGGADIGQNVESTIATLPVGYRPASDQLVPARIATGTYIAGQISIPAATGALNVAAGATLLANANVSLLSIRFSVTP